MRIFAGILLLTVTVFQTFSGFVVQADYFLNRSYIAKVLCINKNKPAMHCNGKCYLSKKLKESENKQAPAAKKPMPEVQLFGPAEPLLLNICIQADSVAYPPVALLELSDFSRSIFHPPGYAVN